MKWLSLALLLIHLTVPARGWLIIPRIGLVRNIEEARLINHEYDMSRVDGDDVAWLEGTARVSDNRWRVALAGHTPGAFERLTEMQAGDLIVVLDDRRMVGYHVVGNWIVNADDVSWLMPTEEPTLTLITCAGIRHRVVESVR